MKITYSIIGLSLVTIFMLMPQAEADVGIGISPTKMVLAGEAEKAQTAEILIFNSGDDPLDISMHAEGDIAAFTKFSISEINIDPEAKPHTLPIKNGKTITVTFTPPAKARGPITGMIVASGGPAEGAQLGGTVGVASQVIYTVSPPASVLSYITKKHVIIAATLVVVIAMLFTLRKKGLRLTFERKE